jgi:hypothetical protein
MGAENPIRRAIRERLFGPTLTVLDASETTGKTIASIRAELKQSGRTPAGQGAFRWMTNKKNFSKVPDQFKKDKGILYLFLDVTVHGGKEVQGVFLTKEPYGKQEKIFYWDYRSTQDPLLSGERVVLRV